MVLRTPDTVEIKEENFLKLAKLSESTNDLDEAMRYYNKALELNPNNPKTLFGKGSVIIRLSTLEAPKIDQALTYFLEAVDNSVGNQKGEILFNASMEIGQFCHDYSSAAFRNFESLLEKVREDTDAYNDYTQILESSWDILCKQIIFSFNKFDMVLETIQEQQIDEILFNFVFICDYLLKGVPSAYRKEYNGPVEVFIPMLWLFVDSDDQLLIEERFKKYSALIKN